MSPLKHTYINKLFAISIFLLGGGVLYYTPGMRNSTQMFHKDLPAIQRIERDLNTLPSSIINYTEPFDIISKAINSDSYVKYRLTGKKSFPLKLNFTLVGIVNGGMHCPVAVIENVNLKTQDIYKIGDNIGRGVLEEIQKDRVSIRIGNRSEILKLVYTSAQERRKGKKVQVPMREIESALADFSSILKGIDLMPSISDDGRRGLIVDGISSGSLLAKVGFKNGDIIRGINGTIVNRPQVLASLYQAIKYLPEESISLARFLVEDWKPFNIDGSKSGIYNEIRKLYSKLETSEEIPVNFTREGREETICLLVIN